MLRYSLLTGNYRTVTIACRSFCTVRKYRKAGGFNQRKNKSPRLVFKTGAEKLIELREAEKLFFVIFGFRGGHFHVHFHAILLLLRHLKLRSFSFLEARAALDEAVLGGIVFDKEVGQQAEH